MQLVPLSAVPSQTLSITLSGQAVSISIYQLGLSPYTGMFCNIASNGTPIITCRLCRAYSGSSTEAPPFMLLDAMYWGFKGDFLFIDTQGDDDPEYSGLGSRWQLVYYDSVDIVAVS